MGFNFGMQETVRGFLVGEVASALQKCVRRSLEEQAVFWAVELDQSGFGGYAWNRMLIIASEDIGIAAPVGFAGDLRALKDNYDEAKKRNSKSFPERLFLIHGAMMLARAPKSRRVDNAVWATYAVREPWFPEIPEFALDAHTARGRAMGQTGTKEQKAVSYHLEDEADLGENQYFPRKEEFGYEDGGSMFRTQWKQGRPSSSQGKLV